MKILIVGGAGYIGSHVAKKLFQEGHTITIFDNLSTGLKSNIKSDYGFIGGDIKNYAEIASAMNNIEAVIHLAALKAAGESMSEPEKYSFNNLNGTINLLNAMCEKGVKKIIFSSTAAVYGEPKYLPIDEKHSTEPINYYGFTKLEIERILTWYSKLKGLDCAILRYFNAVGYDTEGELKGLENNPQNLLPIIMEAIIGQREKVTIFGTDWPTPDGTCIRDYIHVSDLAEGHKLALDYLINNKSTVIVNLGTGKGLSVKEIIDEAKKQSGVDFKVEFGPRREGDPAELYAETKIAKELIGFEAQYSDLETIIRTTLGAYK